MGFTQITEQDVVNKGVVGLPDTPGLSTIDLQKKFDELALEVIIPIFNKVIGELEANTAAQSIGATAPKLIAEGNTLQTILDNIALKIGEVLDVANEAKRISESATTTAGMAESKIDDALNTIKKVSTDVYRQLNNTLDAVNSIVYMYDPVTGKYLHVHEVITNIYDIYKPASITADQYASLGLTADQYAAYQISAYNYSLFAANILGRAEV